MLYISPFIADNHALLVQKLLESYPDTKKLLESHIELVKLFDGGAFYFATTQNIAFLINPNTGLVYDVVEGRILLPVVAEDIFASLLNKTSLIATYKLVQLAESKAADEFNSVILVDVSSAKQIKGLYKLINAAKSLVELISEEPIFTSNIIDQLHNKIQTYLQQSAVNMETPVEEKEDAAEDSKQPEHNAAIDDNTRKFLAKVALMLQLYKNLDTIGSEYEKKLIEYVSNPEAKLNLVLNTAPINIVQNSNSSNVIAPPIGSSAARTPIQSANIPAATLAKSNIDTTINSLPPGVTITPDGMIEINESLITNSTNRLNSSHYTAPINSSSGNTSLSESVTIPPSAGYSNAMQMLEKLESEGKLQEFLSQKKTQVNKLSTDITKESKHKEQQISNKGLDDLLEELL